MQDAPAFAQDGAGWSGLRSLLPRRAASACRRTTLWTGAPLTPPAFELPDAAPPTETPLQKPHLIAIDLRGQTKLITLQAARTTLGRDERCAIVLESPLASRQHAMLICEGDTVVLRDLDSSNGSFVNDEKVQRQRTLRHGDVLTLGEDCFRFLSPPLAYRAPQILDLLHSIPADLGSDAEHATRRR